MGDQERFNYEVVSFDTGTPAEIQARLAAMSPAQRKSHEMQSAMWMKYALFKSMVNLETFICQHPELLMAVFTEPINNYQVPLPFVEKLKRIHIYRGKGDEGGTISVKKALWILVFCPNLHSALLSFSINVQEANFLAEHLDGYRAKSQVKELAISIRFDQVKKDPGTWWGRTSWEGSRSWSHRKTQAASNFLEATKGLVSFELSFDWSAVSKNYDQSVIFSNAFAGLHQSSKTLQFLRILNPLISEDSPQPDYTIFKVLKVLILDLSGLYGALFPSSLRVLALHNYSINASEPVEDQVISQHLISYPFIEEIVVPSRFIGDNLQDIRNDSKERVWTIRRRELEKVIERESCTTKMTLLTPGIQCELSI